MTVESATYLDDLNAALPAAGDFVKEGDDHLRLLKTVLQATFAQIDGAVTARLKDINALKIYSAEDTTDITISAGDNDIKSMGTIVIPTDGLIIPLLAGRFLDTSAQVNYLSPGIKISSSYFYPLFGDNVAPNRNMGGIQADASQYVENNGHGVYAGNATTNAAYGIPAIDIAAASVTTGSQTVTFAADATNTGTVQGVTTTTRLKLIVIEF